MRQPCVHESHPRSIRCMSTIAFIGLGHMGVGMAQRVLAAGHTLHVYNRTAARAAPLAAHGARVCATTAEACDGVDAIISMVADDVASQAVWCGSSGVLSAATKPNAFAIECSTLSHAWVMKLAARARSRGLRYLDAPVTGLPESAATGALTLLIGADNADLSAARPLLDTFSQRIIHFGPVGTGTAYKLIINLLGAVQIASVAESMAIAERAGLDLRTVADAIAAGQAGSPQVIRNSQRMVADSHGDVVFTPKLRLKDVHYALQLARGLGIGSPFGVLAESAFQQLCDLGLSDVNESAVLEVARAHTPTQS
jgi:3-hydroxyisobutyrate dehydrogenase